MGSRDFVMIDTQNVTNPLKLQIISFLIQHMYHCGKVQGKFSDKFGRSLSLVGELFPFTFPYRKYCQYHPLYRVKVSGGPCTIPPDEVLPQVAVKVPVHAFYCPMHSGYCTQPPGTSVKTGDIEPPLGRFLTIRFSLRCSPYFDNRQISIPLFPVRNRSFPRKIRHTLVSILPCSRKKGLPNIHPQALQVRHCPQPHIAESSGLPSAR